VPLSADMLRHQARAIWDAAVAAARPEDLVRTAFDDPALNLRKEVTRGRRILVVGAGKAGAAMSAAVEEVLADAVDRIEGVVNVPAESVRRLRAIELHAARPAGTNQPTAEGVVGAEEILDMVASARPEDIALCLLSGGGSALLPAPPAEVPLEDKQQVTRLLHACGATINEMNTVRKHLSRCKGGQLARAFTGRALFSLIISDVIGDPLEVIASGPTAPDPTTYRDALGVLQKFQLIERGQIPASVLQYLQAGVEGKVPETPKILPAGVHNIIIGNNAKSLAAAQVCAEALGYRVVNLGSYIEGETRHVAVAMAGLVRSIRANSWPAPPPVCLLSGGETTVTLADAHGLGGRNQEFVLAALAKLGPAGMKDVVVLSGGTDGEDGPTHAAGAVADEETYRKAEQERLVPADYLSRHDAYHFFQRTDGLLQTGLTQTNVMDVRVVLIR
jgi:glycerate 2-kinase